MKRFYLFYVYGSSVAGDRNGGMADFETKEAAITKAVDLRDTYPEVQYAIIEGEVVEANM